MEETEFETRIAAALAVATESEAYAAVIDAVADVGDRDVFDRALALLHDPHPRRREAGAYLVAEHGPSETRTVGDVELRVWDHPYPDEAATALLDLLGRETEAPVLVAIAYGFAGVRDPRAVAPLAALRDHPHQEVRFAAVRGLMTHEDPVAVAALIALSADADSDVRDWATFGLGAMIDTDTPEIRAALAARLDDADDETREEGLFGLAARGDERAIAPLATMYADHEGAALDEALCVLAAKTGDERLREWVEWLWEETAARDTPLDPVRDDADARLLAAARRYGVG